MEVHSQLYLARDNYDWDPYNLYISGCVTIKHRCELIRQLNPIAACESRRMYDEHVIQLEFARGKESANRNTHMDFSCWREIERSASTRSRVANMVEDVQVEAIPTKSFWTILAAGATAGLVVDTSLYPIDTIKSRLQTKQGFIKAGGFASLYRGLPPVLVGSIPNAAAFFITYETAKGKALALTGDAHLVSHVIAASFAEVASCLVRVPYEVVKMRSQTGFVNGSNVASSRPSNLDIFKEILSREGYAGLYRGFASTVFRDLPFSAIQFPIWEKLKSRHLAKHNRAATALESAQYGSIAGGISALITNPLDVAKTRIMLANSNEPLASGSITYALGAVYRDRGITGLFAGVVPRVIWISVGAAIFLGSYEQAIKVLTK